MIRRAIAKEERAYRDATTPVDCVLCGTRDAGGTLGHVPAVSVPMPKPQLRNNGYCEYAGVPRLRVPGLAEALPDEGRALRRGYVMLVFSDGGTFFTSTSTVRGDDTYHFS